jgi:hypothetical protein
LSLNELNRDWAEAEQVLGFKIVQDARDEFESLYRPKDDTFLEDFRGGLQDHIPFWKKLYTSFQTSTVKKDTSTSKTGKTRKSLERSYRLVAFVDSRPYKRGTLKDWIRLVEDWNRNNPFDKLAKNTLRVEYSEASREPEIVIQFSILKDLKALKERWAALKGKLPQLARQNPLFLLVALGEAQRLWNQTQPEIEALIKSIMESPLMTQIPNKDALIKTLKEIGNEGNPDIDPAILKDLRDSIICKESADDDYFQDLFDKTGEGYIQEEDFK